MKEILFANIATLALVFAVGYGLATYLTPKKLQPFSLWLSPWYAIILIGVAMTISSLAGVPGRYVAPVLTVILLGLSARAWFRLPRYQVVFWRDILLAGIMLSSILVNQSPLIRSQKLLTLVSLGNNDALVYASGADYLRDHTLLENLVLDRQEGSYDYVGVRNLIQNPYRWGTPAIFSYFTTMLGLEGYQLAYTLQVILFGLTIPMGYVLFSIIFGAESIIGLLLTTGLLSLNAHLLYMLYHNFAGQVLFWGIELFFLIHILPYLSKDNKFTPKLQTYDFVLGATLATLYFSYHEGAIFLIAPLFIFFRSWGKFIKIGLVTITLAGLSVAHGILYDYTQSKLVLGPIGWQVFRDRLPFASPFEMTGLWSIHSLPPLPTILSIVLSLIIVVIFIFGIVKSKYPKQLASYFIVYLILALSVGILHPNFFAYNRVITYVLPVLTPILVCGFMYVVRGYARTKLTILILALGFAAYSGAKLNLKFMRNNLAVDRSLISLTELANNSQVDKTIYLDDVFTKNGNYWRQIWTNYFLSPSKEIISTINPQVPLGGIPENAQVLISKSPWYPRGNFIVKSIIWENDFYKLATICTNEACLLSRKEDLSKIKFGQSLYDDTLLMSGWDSPEGDHRWVNTTTATVRLRSKQIAPRYLVFKVHSLDTPQQVSVEVDSMAITDIELTEKFDIYEIPVIPQKNHLYSITFTFTHGYVPGSNDLRTLYANFESIALE